MQEQPLPTWQGIFASALVELDTARSALSGAAGWLRSDWRPLGTPLPDDAGSARADVLDRIGQLQGQLDRAKDALGSVLADADGAGAGQHDSLVQLDEFAADVVRRCGWAQQHNDGHPSPTWSSGEQLAVALVLRDRAHLDAMGYTVQEAAQRVHGGMASPPSDFGVWVAGIRAALEHPGQPHPPGGVGGGPDTA